MDKIAQRVVETLLAKYAESHLNSTNEIIHFFCVPAIVFSLLGLIWTIHPLVALVLTLFALIYYFMLSVPFALGMVLMSSTMLGVLYVLPQGLLLPISSAVFMIAWMGQFIGHMIEEKKPSFFDDLRFLLVGPLFVLAFLYRRLHIAY